jgi:ABC-type ATPase involved in cell division
VLWFEGVTFQRAGFPVLDCVTFGVSDAEIVVLQGPAGAGKSTLLAIAAGLRWPDSGAVWLAERNIAGLQLSSLPFVRRNIGYLPQESLLIPEETVLENVMLALGVRGESVDTAEADAREVLALVGDSAWEESPAASLSAGQQRLAALARALVGTPPLVVLDEPAAGLGGEERESVLQALSWARGHGCAVLCATAEPAFAEAVVALGGRRIHIEAGRLAGAPAIGLVPAPMRPLGDGEVPADERFDGDEIARLGERFSSGKEPG